MRAVSQTDERVWKRNAPEVSVIRKKNGFCPSEPTKHDVVLKVARPVGHNALVGEDTGLHHLGFLDPHTLALSRGLPP